VIEAKIDRGFAETRTQIVASERSLQGQIVASERALRAEITAARSDARADFRTLIAVTLALWTATVLAVVGALAGHL
jgi:hypothetical protein